MREPYSQFEERKRDHITYALKTENQAVGLSGLAEIQLIHEALPDIDFSEVTLATKSLGEDTSTPFYVSSMTAGHHDSVNLNVRLAKACAAQGWWMGVGSQRRELSDREARQEWVKVRRASHNVVLLGNIGLSQLIHTDISAIEELVEVLQAKAMNVHLNALQECLQPEGTPQFRGGVQKIAELAKKLSVPVIVKETGCGFAKSTLQKLYEAQVRAIDISGLGGTHWGRIEGARASTASIKRDASETFGDWGISTVESLKNAMAVLPNLSSAEVWASGGVRNGLDAAKLIALGAQKVGFAKTILEAAVISDEALLHRMQVIEYEFKTALFCTGSKSAEELRASRVIATKG